MYRLFYLVLVAGVGNVVLRPEVENPYTLYRLLAPIAFATLFALRPMMVLRWLGLFAIFVVYNLILATAYGRGYSQFLPSIIHYLYLFILLVLVIDMKWRYENFDQQFLRFVQWIYAFLLLSLLLEFFVGVPIYPNIPPDESGEPSIRAFFWNQNDLAVVLCVVAWFALTLDRFSGIIRWGVVFVTVLILYYNDSKAALISLIMVSVPVYAILRICATARTGARLWLFTFLIFFAISIPAVIGTVAVTSDVNIISAVSDFNIKFENLDYTVGDLLVNPIINILTLQASGEDLGSLNNRTDAAIFNIIEYMRSWGFGLGAGGSWLVLTIPKYQLGGALSVHNALLQFAVDFGYPIILGYLYMIYWALRRLFAYANSENDRLKVMAILSFPMLGLSQSGAIVTNYFFWASVYFIWLLDRDVPLSRPRHSRVRRLSFAPRIEPSGTETG